MGTTCRVRHTFYNASGDKLAGVVVRFTPDASVPQRVAGLGLVSGQVDVVSSHAAETLGEVDFRLLKGLRGTISLTHLPLVREITVPDVDEADLFDLVAELPDPLEPIDQSFIDLPRSS